MDQAALLALLRKHHSNLAALELQRADYGTAVPLDIVNGLERERAEIERIQQELVSIVDDMAASASNKKSDNVTVTDGQVQSIENKIDNLRLDLHKLDTQQQLTRAELAQMNKRLEAIEARMGSVAGDPFLSIPRAWLIAGIMVMVAVLALLVLINWRLF